MWRAQAKPERTCSSSIALFVQTCRFLSIKAVTSASRPLIGGQPVIALRSFSPAGTRCLTQQAFPMIAPSVLIANAGQQFNHRRSLIQAMPPAGDVLDLIKPSAHHVLANCLAIPVVLFGHVLRPMHQSSRLSGLNPVIERPVICSSSKRRRTSPRPKK